MKIRALFSTAALLLAVVFSSHSTYAGEFGAGFRLVKHHTELHQTPAGSTQQFIYCYCNIS